MNSFTNSHPFLQRFWLYSVCALAISVSLGAAVVSLSKVFVLIAFLSWINFHRRILITSNPFKKLREMPWTITAVLMALTWISISLLWTEADFRSALSSLGKHWRLIWLPIAFALIQTKKQALIVLSFVIGGQAFVVICSWLMWAGFPIPFATAHYGPDLGILFASTLEQPIMGSLLFLLLWELRGHWPQGMAWRLGFYGLVLATIMNVLFVMTGRSGMLAMLLVIGLAIYWLLPRRFRLFALLAPLFFSVLIFNISPRFETRMTQVKQDLMGYKSGVSIGGQGSRIDYWLQSVRATVEKPILGHGVGSWKQSYIRFGGLETSPPTNPHNQYLLWAVEGGGIGLLLLLGIFFSLTRDALRLNFLVNRALIGVIAIAAFVSLMNSPFFGVMMGEFFFITIAALLALHKSDQPLASEKVDAA